MSFFLSNWEWNIILTINKRLSLKHGFGGCVHGFSRCDGLGGFSGFNGLSRFGGFRGLGGFDGLGWFEGFDGFSEFNGYPILSLKGFSVSFILLLEVLYLLVSYTLSYTWLKREPQMSIRKERFIINLFCFGKKT